MDGWMPCTGVCAEQLPSERHVKERVGVVECSRVSDAQTRGLFFLASPGGRRAIK